VALLVLIVGAVPVEPVAATLTNDVPLNVTTSFFAYAVPAAYSPRWT
jgi:hypothetical protein